MAETAQTCAVMFADLAGSTALYDRLGDVAAQAAVQQALSLMTRICSAHRGKVIKTIGDEVLVRYPDANLAAQAAITLQMTGDLRLGGKAAGVRIGFHVGEVIDEGGDIFGDVVNVSARLTAAARAGQVLTTETAVATLSADLRERARAFDVVQFKGKTRPLQVFELVWEEADSVTRMPTRSMTPRTGKPADCLLQITLGGRTLSLDEEHLPFTLGRDATCGMIVNARLASRVHAALGFQRGHFMLSDHSTNGTYVVAGGNAEVFLRRETMPLIGSGTISLGSPAESQPDVVVGFRAS
ncbi:MAG TPA: adenylate/guanylate cyclase domain-containing protein [Candidatus Binatia bacterium]|nr:adenylate/guanylate cyclase domain-containing protein [Candidatus Binatia bacterium]